MRCEAAFVWRELLHHIEERPPNGLIVPKRVDATNAVTGTIGAGNHIESGHQLFGVRGAAVDLISRKMVTWDSRGGAGVEANFEEATVGGFLDHSARVIHENDSVTGGERLAAGAQTCGSRSLGEFVGEDAYAERHCS